MANEPWKRTSEPYVKVTENVIRTSIQPGAGGDLIIGCVVVSDTGPTTPTYITSRTEFKNTYFSKDLDKEYVTSLDQYYNRASTMILNGVRLSASANLLVCRASGLKGVTYMKSLGLDKDTNYIIKQGEILKKTTGCTINLSDTSNWNISISNLGKLGTTSDCDYKIQSLNKLVEFLNDSSEAHITDYEVTYGYTEEDDDEGNKIPDGTAVLTISSGYLASDLVEGGYNSTYLSGWGSNSFSDVVNYATNENNTAGNLKLIINKDEDIAGYYTITVEDGDNKSTYQIGPDYNLGQITLDEFNNLVTSVQLQISNIEEVYNSIDKNSSGEAVVELSIKDDDLKLLSVTESDIEKAWDAINEDERYVVEGLCDLGDTTRTIQTHISSIASSANNGSNMFYPASPVESTNYLTIVNGFSKLTTDNMNIFKLCPWDNDDGTVGFRFSASPAVLYWEAVMRNKAANNEFAGVFGETNGVVSPVSLATNFSKPERELMLIKKINTIFTDVSLDTVYINDNWTAQSAKDVMSEENNVRMKIRISKAMPVLLSQFRGRQPNSRTWDDAKTVVETWFKNTVKSWGYGPADWKITCDETNNTDEVINNNGLRVRVQVKYYKSIKYIDVYHDIYPIGVDFE